MNSDRPDKLHLLNTIKLLCTKKIRQPITMEQTKAWLKQFNSEQEDFLGLLILRHLIYRTNNQLDSSLKQALKLAALHFTPNNIDKQIVDWRDVINGQVDGLDFIFGPPKQSAARPGKSGEIISRRIKSCDPKINFTLRYPADLNNLEKKQRYLLIDDGAFTGSQIAEFLSNEGRHLAESNQCGIVVGVAHTEAVSLFKNKHPNVPFFYGELVTKNECFEEICQNWVNDRIWPFAETNPFDLYKKISLNAKFSNLLPLGFGDLGCMIAYEHGVPDNSLQLLWDKSKLWIPLISR